MTTGRRLVQEPLDRGRPGRRGRRLADRRPGGREVAGCAAQALTLAHAGHGRRRAVRRWPRRPQGGDGVGAADAVGGQAGVALEVGQGSRGRRPEDAVDPAGVEAERAEPALQLGDVVAPQHRGAVVEQPVAEPVAGLDQRPPRSGRPQMPSTRRPGSPGSGGPRPRCRAELARVVAAVEVERPGGAGGRALDVAPAGSRSPALRRRPARRRRSPAGPTERSAGPAAAAR